MQGLSGWSGTHQPAMPAAPGTQVLTGIIGVAVPAVPAATVPSAFVDTPNCAVYVITLVPSNDVWNVTTLLSYPYLLYTNNVGFAALLPEIASL